MPETPAEQGTPVTLKIVVPTETEGVPVVYANHFQATFSPEDMTLHLGWYALPAFTEPPPEDQPVEVHVRPVLKVTVPLNLVRGIITVLENQLQGWEQAFGAPVPAHPNPPSQEPTAPNE